jgi:hypothetical protein
VGEKPLLMDGFQLAKAQQQGRARPVTPVLTSFVTDNGTFADPQFDGSLLLRPAQGPAKGTDARACGQHHRALRQCRLVLSPEFAEDAIALAFTKKHGNNLRYTAAWGRWSVWNGTRWESDNTGLVLDLARIFRAQGIRSPLLFATSRTLSVPGWSKIIDGALRGHHAPPLGLPTVNRQPSYRLKSALPKSLQ